MLGRSLANGEVVHHIDRNGKNNCSTNLMVFRTASDHNRHHALKHKGVLIKHEDGSYSCQRKEPFVDCLICGEPCKRSTSSYCSHQCHVISRQRKTKPSRVELYRMLWNEPTTNIAAKYGISDNAVSKWAKGYGINKPPRGFWRTMKTGGIKEGCYCELFWSPVQIRHFALEWWCNGSTITRSILFESRFIPNQI